MQLRDARKILGLGPDEDPRPHLKEFRNARERIASMVRTAPNETLADRYQQGLVEFDQALAAVREYLEALGLVEAAPDAGHPAKETPAKSVVPDPEPEPAMAPDPAPGRALSRAAWIFVFLIGATGGGIIYYKNEEAKRIRIQERVTLLETLGSKYIENRNWQEASDSFSEIARISPKSGLPRLGMRSIEAGMAEEQTQYVGYWTGQAIAELEAGRLDPAEAAARRIVTRFPGEAEAAALLERIAGARASQAHASSVAAAKSLLDASDWTAAITAAEQILQRSPSDPDAASIASAARAGLQKRAGENARALEMLEFARARDQGVFDQEALDALREAAALFPENPEIAAQLEKMASYSRTLRVPAEYATPAEAIATARPRDRVLLAEQVWEGPLIINIPLDLQGAGSGKTIVECPATEACAVTIGPAASGTRVSGITFRHEAFHAEGSDRFSAALVRAASATFLDCHFTDASGHGLAVIERGQVIASRCHFNDNGWNGAAVIGPKSFLEIRDSEALSNFEHGIESWDGAAVILANNRCEKNTRNGIHADNLGAEASIENNRLIANREFGLVLDSAGSGKVSGNTASQNLLGGFVIRTAAASVRVYGNEASRNKGPGIVLEKGLEPDAYSNNTTTGNKPKQILAGADLSHGLEE